jgi:superfamily II DNA or RNA helicase
MTPAATQAKVCFGLVKDVPYRFFFSGTQMRSDGLDLLLDAITGPIVYRMSVREGVDQGFLAQPVFRMVHIKSDIQFDSPDVNEMTRVHAFYNPKMNAMAAELINKAVSLMSRPTLVLVDELEQFGLLKPLLRYDVKFAHGGVTKENKSKVPEEFHDSDPKALVAAFNAGEFPILVGTSCISTGTDFLGVRCIVNLRQGKSEVEIKQCVGRGTRKVEGKEDFLYIDFCIDNVEDLARHAKARKDIYADIYPSYKDVAG